MKTDTLIAEVDALLEEHPGCGVEKMYYVLKPDWLGRDRFINLMMDLGYRRRMTRSYTRTTFSGVNRYQNLIEGMLLWDRNQLWQSDITYFRVGSSFYYLVFIVDVYSKQILGYQANDHMRASANLDALRMAIKNCGGNINGLIHHSDRGSQYGDRNYTNLLTSNGALISMGIKAQENAYAERVNGIIKNEYLNLWEISTMDELKRKLKNAVTHYNGKRPHRSLPKKSTPNCFVKDVLSLTGQRRPTVIVYAEGKVKIKGASSPLDFWPEKTLQAPVCPIVNDSN